MRKEYLGWITAAVVAAVLGGLLGWQLMDDDGTAERRAGALSAPENIPPEAQQLAEAKKDAGRDADAPAGQEPPRVGASQQDCSPSDPPNVEMVWRFRPKSKDELKNKAKHVVQAEVVSASQAAPLVLENPNEPGGQETIPRQEVVLSVQESFKGGKKQGDTIRVTKLGGPCFRVTDDPNYAAGQEYLLALEDASQRGKFRPVSPEGRYAVADDGTLSPVAHESEVANEFAKKNVKEVGQELGG